MYLKTIPSTTHLPLDNSPCKFFYLEMFQPHSLSRMSPPAGSSTLAVIKQARCLHACLTEVGSAGLLARAASAAGAAGSPASTPGEAPSPESRASAELFLRSVLGALPALARSANQAVQEEIAKCAYFFLCFYLVFLVCLFHCCVPLTSRSLPRNSVINMCCSMLSG